jgi:hypothetical protein
MSRAPRLLARAFAGTLLAAGCAEVPSPPAASVSAPVAEAAAGLRGDGLLRLVPASAEVLLAVDLVQLKASPWTRDVLDAARAEKGRAARARERGFDEIGDVDEMLLASLPVTGVEAGTAVEEDGSTLLLVRGRIDRTRALDAAKARWPQAVTTSFRGRPIVSQGLAAVAFVDAETFASGPLPVVRAAIDCASGMGPHLGRAEWLENVRQASRQVHGRRPARAAVELAAVVTPELRQRMKHELGDGEELRFVGARMDLAGSLDVAIVGATGTRQQANDLAARLTESIRHLRTRESIAALGLDAVLAHLSCGASGALLVGRLTVSENQREMVGERMKILARLIGSAGGDDAAEGEVAPPAPR